MKKMYQAVYTHEDDVYTENAVPGQKVNDEQLITVNNVEYRRWDPYRSKLGAAVAKSIPEISISKNSSVLYLGAASGTTPSHVAEIASEGIVFGVEYSAKVIRDLLSVAKDRKNIAPILGDARKPDTYAGVVGKVDTIVQDVAQPDQARIAAINAQKFLKQDGSVLLAIKARSISSSQSTETVFNEVKSELLDTFSIDWESRLEPYEQDHMFLSLSL